MTYRTGMNLVDQDARGGRAISGAFECYGNPYFGGNLGPFNGSQVAQNGTSCRASNPQAQDGSTLAQIVANVDILVIMLGTNDNYQSTQIGQLGDLTTSGTFYGTMRWIVETYRKAKPTLRVIMVTLGYNANMDNAGTGRYRDATVAYARSAGIPVLDMLAVGGVASDNSTTFYPDGLHHTAYYDKNFYGPIIAQFLIQSF